MGNFIAAVHVLRQVLVGRIVTMDGNGTIYPHGAVCIEADRIAAVVADPGCFRQLGSKETYTRTYTRHTKMGSEGNRSMVRPRLEDCVFAWVFESAC